MVKDAMVNVKELDELLGDIGPELLEATDAQGKTVNSELPLAKKVLRSLTGMINGKIANTQRCVVQKFDIPVDSPAISLVAAALRKRKYNTSVDGNQTYTQFIIEWK